MGILNRPKPWLLNDISEEVRDYIFESSKNQNIRIGVLVNSILIAHIEAEGRQNGSSRKRLNRIFGFGTTTNSFKYSLTR